MYDFVCLLEDANVLFGDLNEADSIYKPTPVSCAANCCDKHRHPLCIVDENYDNLIECWLNELKTLCADIRQKHIMGEYIVTFG